MKKSKNLFACFTDVHAIVAMALFIALSVLIGKLPAFNPTPTIRFSIENLPIFVAAATYGPIAGATVGLLADVIGCFLAGYTIFPIITLGAVSIGLIAGIFSQINCNKYLKSIITVVPAHIVGSVIIKTIGLYIHYGFPFWLNLIYRAGAYTIISIVEITILQILYSQKIIQKFGGLRKK